MTALAKHARAAEAWQKIPVPSGGINVSQTFQDIHDFALKTFDSLDQDGDGFLSHQELQNAAADELTGWREKSFLYFLDTQSTKLFPMLSTKSGHQKTPAFHEWICRNTSDFCESE